MISPTVPRVVVNGRAPSLVAELRVECEGRLSFFQVERDLFRGAEDARAAVVELSLPARDDYGGEAVADDVDARAPHVHQLVNAEDDGDAERAVAGQEGDQSREQYDERRARHRPDAFRRYH